MASTLGQAANTPHSGCMDCMDCLDCLDPGGTVRFETSISSYLRVAWTIQDSWTTTEGR